VGDPRRHAIKYAGNKKNLQEIKHTPLNINKTRKRNRKKRESSSRVGWN
jgi:hypothetical protein